MKNFKLPITILLVAIMAFSMMACTKAPGTSTGESSATTAASAAATTKPENITLEIWHNATNRDDPAHMAVFNVIDRFRSENPNITVNDSGQTTDNNKTRIRTAAAANELPNVFFTWGYNFSKDMGETGLLLDLTPYLDDEIKSQLKPGALDAATYAGKPYGLPDNGWVNVIYFNKALFDKYKLAIPKTVDELFAVSKEFRKNGVQPFLMGAKQGSTVTQLWESISLRLVGAKKLNASYTDPAVLDDPNFLKAAQVISQMGKENVFADTCYNFVNPEAAAAFITGEYAMISLNAGFVGLLESPDSKVAGNVAAIPTFFNVDGVQNYETENQSGFPGQWVAASRNKYPDIAFKLLKFVSLNVSQYYYEGGSHQIAYIRDDWDTSKQSKLYQDINQFTQQFTAIVLYGSDLRKQEVVPNLSDLAVALARNKITPEDFISQTKALYK